MTEFIFGTAGLRSKYATENKTPSEFESRTLLNRCHASNIKIIDTALNYMSSHDFLSKHHNGRFKIGTKLDYNFFLDEANCMGKVKDILHKMNLSTFEYLLLHSLPELSSNELKIVSKNISRLKEIGLTNSVGASVYYLDDLHRCLELFSSFDIVQAPLNFCDQRFIDSSLVKSLNDANVQIHYRSIFLQGILLQSRDQRRNYFKQFRELQLYDDLVQRQFDGDALKFNMAFLKNVTENAYIVLGLYTRDQFSSFFTAWDSQINKVVFPHMDYNEDLVIPMNWIRN